jgi:hypothetical protein
MSYLNQPGGNDRQQDMPYLDDTYPTYACEDPRVTQMPGSVRSAQVLGYIAAGIAAVGLIDRQVLGVVWPAGPSIGISWVLSPFALAVAAAMCAPLIGVFLCALRFGASGDGARITAIVFASFLILFGLVLPGSAGTLAELGMGIAIVVTLAQRQSVEWFNRPIGRGRVGDWPAGYPAPDA